jgi:trimethylamine:corrinoid methyltransferase-like protein
MNTESIRPIKAVKFKNRFDLMEKEQAEAIDRASRHILEKVGIKMPLASAMDLMEEAGARVDRGRSLVYITSRSG